jgi:hypothetical protein
MEWLVIALVLAFAACALWWRHGRSSARKDRAMQRELTEIVTTERSKPAATSAAPSGLAVAVVIPVAPGEPPKEEKRKLSPSEAAVCKVILARCEEARPPVVLNHRAGWLFRIARVGDAYVIIRDHKKNNLTVLRRYVCTAEGFFSLDEARSASSDRNVETCGMTPMELADYDELRELLTATYRTA